MHEWALADAVVAAVVASGRAGKPGQVAAQGRAAPPAPVTVLVGELQSIDRDIFSFALESLGKEASLPAGIFRIETEAAQFKCRACAASWDLGGQPGLGAEEREAIHFLPESAHAFVRCPACGSVDFAVEKGRGVRLAEGSP